MNLRPLVVGIACLLCSQPDWSASLRPLAARVPPLPASAADAAKVFKVNAQGSVEAPAPALTLRKDIEAAIAAAGINASQATPGAMTPEQGEALARRVQSMSQAEQVAYALQMQQQMMGNMGGGFSVSEGEQAAADQLNELRMTFNTTQADAIGLQQKTDALVAAWDAEGGRTSGFDNSAVLCNEAQRATLLKENTEALARAERRLAQSAALDQELRAQSTKLLADADRASTLLTQIKAAPLRASLGSVDFAATQSVAAILDLRTRLYIESGRRTSGFAQERVFLQQAKLAPSESECLNGL